MATDRQQENEANLVDKAVAEGGARGHVQRDLKRHPSLMPKL